MTSFLTQGNFCDWQVQGSPFPMVRKKEQTFPLPGCLLIIGFITLMAVAMATVMRQTFFDTPYLYLLPGTIFLFLLPTVKWAKTPQGHIFTLEQDRVTLKHFPHTTGDAEIPISEYMGVLKYERQRGDSRRYKISLIHRTSRRNNIKLYVSDNGSHHDEVWHYFCNAWNLPGLEQDADYRLIITRPR